MKKVRQTFVPYTITLNYDANEKHLVMSEVIEKLESFEKNIKAITHVENINEFMSRPCTR
jgi:hypothetical protein